MLGGGERSRLAITLLIKRRSPDGVARAAAHDPQRSDSATAMPMAGVTQAQARDIAAYLYWIAR